MGVDSPYSPVCHPTWHLRMILCHSVLSFLLYLLLGPSTSLFIALWACRHSASSGEQARLERQLKELQRGKAKLAEASEASDQQIKAGACFRTLRLAWEEQQQITSALIVTSIQHGNYTAYRLGWHMFRPICPLWWFCILQDPMLQTGLHRKP